MSGLEGVGSVLEEAGGSGLGLTSSSSAYVRQSSCDTRGWGREAQSEINLKEFSPEMAQKKNYSEQLRKKDGYGVSCVHSIFFSKQIPSLLMVNIHKLQKIFVLHWVRRTSWNIQFTQKHPVQ